MCYTLRVCCDIADVDDSPLAVDCRCDPLLAFRRLAWAKGGLSMPSQSISLHRLRFYEAECRRMAATQSSDAQRQEFKKFEEAFQRKAAELEAVELQHSALLSR